MGLTRPSVREQSVFNVRVWKSVVQRRTRPSTFVSETQLKRRRLKKQQIKQSEASAQTHESHFSQIPCAKQNKNKTEKPPGGNFCAESERRKKNKFMLDVLFKYV